MEYRQGCLYRSMRALVRIFYPHMQFVFEEPLQNEPTLIVCNHARMHGPIALCARFPQADRLTAWINAPMLSCLQAPAYIRKDYWWQPGRWYSGLLDHTLAYFAALFIVPILRSSGGIPVYHDARALQTLRDSMHALQAGRILILFPEKPQGYGVYSQDIMSGFLRLARQYWKKEGRLLHIIPAQVDITHRQVNMGKAVVFDPDLSSQQLEEIVRESFTHQMEEKP